MGTSGLQEYVLIVDDEPDLVEGCTRILEAEGFRCLCTSNSVEAVSIIREMKPVAVVMDYIMPQKNGLSILREVMAEFTFLPVIMISAYATTDDVVTAVKSGAFDYITKPFSADQLVIAVKRACEKYRLSSENHELRMRLQKNKFDDFFAGRHPRFLKAVELIRRIANTEASVLICGETGTGKNMAAKAIHLTSKREPMPFVTLECNEITGRELEYRDAPGAESPIAAANGGTLFLNRIEELGPELQGRLTRILQTASAPRDGEWRWIPVNLRIVASASEPLEKLVTEKRFREDLYYCLNVVKVELPPLRERREDIVLLAEIFLKHHMETGGASYIMRQDVLDCLTEYWWPGNVRQLKNVIDHAVELAGEGLIEIRHIPEEIVFTEGIGEGTYKNVRNRFLDNFEKKYLESLMARNHGNIAQASRESGLSRMSLYRMLDRTGLKKLVDAERMAERDGEGVRKRT